MPTAVTMIQDAIRLAQKKQFPSARKILLAKLDDAEVGPRALELLQALVIKGNGKEAKAAPKSPPLAGAITFFNKLMYPESRNLLTVHLCFWPFDETALWYLAMGYYRQQKYETALRCFELSLSISPKTLNVHKQRGMTIAKTGDWRAGLSVIDQVAKQHPNDPDVDHLRAEILNVAGEFDKAQYHYEQAIEANPKVMRSYISLAQMLKEMGKPDMARTILQTALSHEPNNNSLRLSLAVIDLLDRDFEKGWPGYANRHAGRLIDYFTSRHPNINNVTAAHFRNQWDGKSRYDKLLIWPDQGIGDEVRFASALKLLPSHESITLQVDKRLVTAFQRSMPDLDIVPVDVTLDFRQFSHHVPLGTLPSLLLKTRDDFNHIGAPFLKADEGRRQEFFSRYRGEKPLIGISWHSISPKLGKLKSIPLDSLIEALLPLNVDFVNLQYGEYTDQCEAVMARTGVSIHLAQELDKKDDIEGLMAMIAACDHIVTISNATIHLTGALGKPAHLVIPVSSDWQWGRSETTSIWYDSVNIFRQDVRGSWDPVLQTMAKDLERTLGK